MTRPRPVAQWPVLVWTAFVWVLLWGDLSVANVLAGAVLGLFVLVVLPQRALRVHGRVRPRHLARLVWSFGTDLVAASWQVSTIVLLRPQVTSAVIEVRLRTSSTNAAVAIAELISLVPGSLVIETRRSTRSLFVHVLDVSGDAEVDEFRRSTAELEERVVRALCSDAEVEELERGTVAGHPRAAGATGRGARS